MASKKLELFFMNMVMAVLVALFYKAYNIPIRNDVKEYALIGIEKFQDQMNLELDLYK